MYENLMRLDADSCLIMLGDLCMGDDLQVHEEIFERMQCRKILVKGNHDSKSYSWYMENGWDFACDAFKMDYAGKNVLFSHRPQAWDGFWDINIHGHLHNLGHREQERKRLKRWHILYAPEDMDYKPIELSKFIQSKKL